MRTVRVVNDTRRQVLGTRVSVADRWWQRLRGLSGQGSLPDGAGLILSPCRAVHMHGMRFPLDVAFVGADGGVVALYPELRPGARTRWHRAARYALELPAGVLRDTDTREGDRLTWAGPLVDDSHSATPEPAT